MNEPTIVVEQTAKPKLAANAPPPAAGKDPAAKPKPLKTASEKPAFDPKIMGAATLPPAASSDAGKAEVLAPKWDPQSAAEFVVGAHNAPGLAMFHGNEEKLNAWEADPKEISSAGAKALGRILDRTPLDPEGAGIAGLIPQIIIGVQSLIRLEVTHWHAVQEADKRQSTGKLPGVHPPTPAPPSMGAVPAPVSGPPQAAPGPTVPPVPAPSSAIPSIDVNAEGPIFVGDVADFLRAAGAHAENGRRNATL